MDKEADAYMKKKDSTTGRFTATHNMTNTPLYNKWASIKGRCYCRKTPHYKNYGNKGITMCDEWKNDFMAFYNWAMANGYSKELQLDRKDNKKGYNPDNCRFVTCKVNNRNKSNNHMITISGITRTLAEWAEISGISKRTLRDRAIKGYSDDAMLLPPGSIPLRISKLLTIGEKTMSIREWAEISGIPLKTLYRRLEDGWRMEDLLKPLDKSQQRHVKKKTSEV
jgi:hypothetical protein